MRFIGDIHGDVYGYEHIINGCTESVQVGDFGVGFLGESLEAHADQIHKDGRHKFIRGNHDDPARCKERVGYIEDGTYDERGILYVGGAWSIDWAFRTQGYSWWEDEELSTSDFVRMHEYFVYHKPRVMITHDAPTSIAYEMFLKGTGKKQYRTRTADALEGMFQRHQPEVWIFGHWHIDKELHMHGTKFTCLGINSCLDLNI